MKPSAVKKITVNQLKIGMYLHDLSCGWIDHPFMRNRFMLSSDAEVGKVVAAGIREVYIDTGRGLDVSDAPTHEEVRAGIERELAEIAVSQAPAIQQATLVEELERARPIRAQAQQLVSEMMRDVRPGKAIEMGCVEPVVQNITESIFRNSGALHHHERYNGSGYPEGLEVAEISALAQMASIVDVYDAITSDRVYHKGLPPVEALRRIFEWSKYHFNPLQVHAFLRCVGIYPVGTLVLLESGRLAAVTENSASSLLTPKVKVFFSTKTKNYFEPKELDLSGQLVVGGDRILGYEDPAKWDVDPMRITELA